ncbi:MAG: hypothetical protein C5B51_08300 [Terriglobia bacterium]|nr:MAG: hypothetical protein C5B51_08300 [Terriglobia bacterium]
MNRGRTLAGEHVIVCGEAPLPSRVKAHDALRLKLSGDDRNIDLEIVDISRKLATNVPDFVADLVEIAAYIYCADQQIPRGGEGVMDVGASWRRPFVFHIPVRAPGMWSAHPIVEALRRTLTFLSEDTYDFHFSKLTNPIPMQQYLKFEDGHVPAPGVDEVILFSGGLDSLGGAVKEAVREQRRLALVSHRSTPKIFSRQKELVKRLQDVCKTCPPIHVPVWVHKRGLSAREYTQRTRSFLYAVLAFAVAHVFQLQRIRFYENGVVSLNLPISEQAIGARATRTTHPQTLAGFAELFSNLIGADFSVENPFLWNTKAQVVNLIGEAGCGDLISQSVSCMHTHEQTAEHPHCGRCSQCVWRRFATLASAYAEDDCSSLYGVDLLTGMRLEEKDRTLVESFIRVATDLGRMNELQLVQTYGEISRVLRHLAPLSSNQVAENLVGLFSEHASEVCRVMDKAIAEHASEIREGRLPASCAIVLAVAERYRTANSPEITSSKPKLRRSAVNLKPRRKQPEKSIQEIRARIRQMKGENMSAQMMCKSLGNAPRPPAAAWAHLSWPEAWKSVHQNSVKVWLSRNSKIVK